MTINAGRAVEIEAAMEALVKKAVALDAAKEAGDEAEAHKIGLDAANSLLTWTPIEHGAMTIAFALGVGKLTEEKDRLETEVKDLEGVIATLEKTIVKLATQRRDPQGIMVGDDGAQVNTFNESKGSKDV